MLGVVLPAGVIVATYGFVFMSWLMSDNWAHLLSNFVLLCVLGAAYFAWILAHVRGAVTAPTGTGFLVAGLAVLQRAHIELLLSMMRWPPRIMLPDSTLWDAVRFGRTLGWVGLAFGLACVVAACVSERTLRARARGLALRVL